MTPVERGSRVMNVINVLRGSKEIVARNVPLVSKVTSVRNVRRTTTETLAVRGFPFHI